MVRDQRIGQTWSRLENDFLEKSKFFANFFNTLLFISLKYTQKHAEPFRLSVPVGWCYFLRCRFRLILIFFNLFNCSTIPIKNGSISVIAFFLRVCFHFVSLLTLLSAAASCFKCILFFYCVWFHYNFTFVFFFSMSGCVYSVRLICYQFKKICPSNEFRQIVLRLLLPLCSFCLHYYVVFCFVFSV